MSLLNEANEIDITLTKKQTLFWDALFDEQGLINQNDFDEFAFFGGFGSSKSFITSLCTWHICQTYSGTHWLYVRKTYPELMDSVIPQFNDLFQGAGYKYLDSKRNAIFDNGSVIYFRAFDKDTKILSNQYHGATLCQGEETPEELFLQIFGRLRLKGLGKNPLIIEGNPDNTWPKRRYKDNPLPKNIYFMEATTYDNPNVSPEYIERMRQNYPEAWFRRYVMGEWNNYDEMVYSEFRDRYIIDPISIKYMTYWKIRLGLDYGWRNPTAILWGGIDHDGNLIIWDEFYSPEKTTKEIAKEARRWESQIGKKVIVADYSIKRPDRDGRSVWDDLLKEGLNLLESNKDELSNIQLINMLFKQDRIKITRNCENLIREIKNYKWKRLKLGEEKNAPETPIDKDNHALDAMAYLIASLEEFKGQDPEKVKFKNSIAYHTQKFERKSGVLMG